MAYLAYNFIVSPPQPGSEILIALIADFGFDSFDYNDKGFIAYINEDTTSDLDFSEFQFDDFKYTFTIEKIETKNWNEEWENNFEPVFVDDLLCIRAPFHKQVTGIKKEIVIMPKMSFGTGHHQTTRLVCKQMFATDFKNKKVLDMGTGTGILAILAKMLGASKVLGIDIDEWSVENAKENCLTNGYADIALKKGDVDLLNTETGFDIILANINKNILKAQIPYYSKTIQTNGLLFLSGFFTTDIEELSLVAAENDFQFLESFNENEWAMMLLKKI